MQYLQEPQAIEIGHHITLIDRKGDEHPKIIRSRKPFVMNTGDLDTNPFSAVATGNNSSNIKIEALEPDDNELLQVLIGFDDGCKYRINLPAGVRQLGTDEDPDVGYLTNQDSPRHDPRFEIFLFKKLVPHVIASNATGQTITPELFTRGWRYLLGDADRSETTRKIPLEVEF